MTYSPKQELSILKQVSNTIGAFIYSKDLKGNYTYVNQNVLTFLGKPIEQVIGYGDSNFFKPETYQRIQSTDQDVISRMETIVVDDTLYLEKTGETRSYRAIKSPLYNEDGEIIGLCGAARDITEELQLKKIIADQQNLVDLVLNNIDACVYMKSEDQRYLYANAQLAELYDLPISKIIGAKESDILPAGMAANFNETDQKVFVTNEIQRSQETATDKNGVEYHYLSVKVPTIQNNKPALIGFSTDISELYKMKEQFKRLANTDYLTNLYNRRYFIKQGEREFSRAKRYNSPFAIVSLDIDHFKAVNDNFGHPAGDQVLKEVSRLLLSSIRKEDILARMGGEEFTILLPETDFEKSKVLAERIRYTIQNNPIQYGDLLPINITISLGVTLVNETDTNFYGILVRVDEALYKAKADGRNQVCCL